MKRTQIIAPLIVLAMAVVFLAVNKGRKDHQYFVTMQTWQIGNDLINATNSHQLVVIGTGLIEQLSQLLSSQTKVADVLIGDEPEPIGDDSADSRLMLVNDHGKRLGIRLRQDSQPERFHVVGYWNLDHGEDLKR